MKKIKLDDVHLKQLLIEGKTKVDGILIDATISDFKFPVEILDLLKTREHINETIEAYYLTGLEG